MTSSLALALKVRTHPPMPLVFGGREEPSGNSDEEEEEMDAAEADNGTEGRLRMGNTMFTQPARLV